jgi:hypothetical protein
MQKIVSLVVDSHGESVQPATDGILQAQTWKWSQHFHGTMFGFQCRNHLAMGARK